MVPQLSVAEEVSSLIQVIHGMNRFGVTSAIDAGNRGYPKLQANVAVLARDNRFNLRMPFVDMQFGDGTPMNMVDAQIETITKTCADQSRRKPASGISPWSCLSRCRRSAPFGCPRS
jgi:hypothetical protein